MVVFDIIWDVDEEDVVLPSIVVVPDRFIRDFESMGSSDDSELLEDISDWLSEKYEFLYDGFCVDYTDHKLQEYLEGKFETAAEDYIDELDFYMELIEAGITTEHVREYMGNEKADHMKLYCEEHGLI